MSWYKISIEPYEGNSFYAESKQFDVGVYASSEEDAVSSLKGLMVDAARKMMLEDESVVSDNKVSDGKKDLYVEIDMNKEFRESMQESTRKNISLPMWMDVKLRNLGVDASKLFQEAASRKIDEMTRPAQRVNTLEQFKSIADKDTLKRLVKEYLNSEI